MNRVLNKPGSAVAKEARERIMKCYIDEKSKPRHFVFICKEEEVRFPAFPQDRTVLEMLRSLDFIEATNRMLKYGKTELLVFWFCYLAFHSTDLFDYNFPDLTSVVFEEIILSSLSPKKTIAIERIAASIKNFPYLEHSLSSCIR